MVPGPIHGGVCGLALLGAAAVVCAGDGNGQCEIHTNEADFLAAVAGLGLTLAEVEDFEPPVSNLGPLDYAGLADPLEGGVANVDPASGLGFPAGLSGTLLSLQSNIVQQNADSALPGNGLAAIGPWFLDPLTMVPESVEVGADIFVESTDLLFPFGSDVAAVGFRLRVAFHDSAEVAVFEVFDDVLVARQTLPIAPGQEVFVGVVCLDGFTEIGRINVGGPGGELVDDVQVRQAPVGACCIDGTCFEYTQTACNSQKGLYLGDGIACTSNPCPTGACCLADGNCSEGMSLRDCEELEGVYRGDDTTCSPNPCPIGACCLPDASCTDDVSLRDCEKSGGTYQGDDSLCADGCDFCGPDAGDCCAGNPTPGCNDAACCAAVCAVDSFCCGVDAGFWEAPRCVDLAVELCGGLCRGVTCPEDCGDGDGIVGITDFLALLAQWGTAGGSCDFNGMGVGINEFLQLLASWGNCPIARGGPLDRPDRHG